MRMLNKIQWKTLLKENAVSKKKLHDGMNHDLEELGLEPGKQLDKTFVDI